SDRAALTTACAGHATKAMDTWVAPKARYAPRGLAERYRRGTYANGRRVALKFGLGHFRRLEVAHASVSYCVVPRAGERGRRMGAAGLRGIRRGDGRCEPSRRRRAAGSDSGVSQ